MVVELFGVAEEATFATEHGADKEVQTLKQSEWWHRPGRRMALTREGNMAAGDAGVERDAVDRC